MSARPIVSVYLPTRDRARVLPSAVESVLAQAEPSFELIIVDDASQDDTPALCRVFSARDARVRVIRKAHSAGASAARNDAIAAARGEFITGIDDDDLMLPNRLASLLAQWTDESSFVSSSYWLERSPGARRTKLHAGARLIDLNDLLYQNVVGNQLLTRTRFLKELGGFDEQFVASQDYDLWTRLVARFGAGRRINVPTYIMRQGLTSLSISSSTKFGEGARQYTQKHAPLMNAAQRRSQALLHRITARQPVPIMDWPKLFAMPTAGLLIRYALSRVRGVRRLRDLLFS